MSFTKFVIFLITIIVANINGHDLKGHHFTYLAQILKSRNNLFKSLHENTQKIVNSMFDTLDLVEEFSKDPKNKLLLAMHYDLNNMADKNFEMYDLLKNASAIKVNKTAININHLGEIVKEISSNTRTTVTEPQYVTNHKVPRYKFNKTKKRKVVFSKTLKKRAEDDVNKKLNISSKSKQSEDDDLKIWNPDPWTSLEAEMFKNATAYRRIYGGKKTNIVSYPFVVSIHILNDFTCAGSIISKDLVITAASCLQLHYNNRFFRETPKTTFVRVGSDWISRRGEMVPVLEIYFHPMYDPKTLNHNLAVVRITRTLNLGSRRRAKIRRILLDRGDGYLPENTHQIKILGWGAKSPSQVINVFQKLTIAKLDIYGINECKEIYSSAFVTRNHFCAGYISRGIGACNRDVGGPAFTDNFLIGIISFGSPVCGTEDSPTVFTRVGHYYGWIENIMRKPVVRFGVPITQTPANKLIIYFNTITTTNTPHIYPLNTLKVRPLLSEVLNLRADESLDLLNATTVPSKISDADVVYAIDDGNDATPQDKLQGNTGDHHEIIKPEKELNVSKHSINNITNSLKTTKPNTTKMTKHVSTQQVRFSTVSSSALPYKNENDKPDARRFDDTNGTGEFDETKAFDDANVTSDFDETKSYNDVNVTTDFDETKSYNDVNVKSDFDETKAFDDMNVTGEFDETKVSDDANMKHEFDEMKLSDNANVKPKFDDANGSSNSNGKYTNTNSNMEAPDDVYNADEYD